MADDTKICENCKASFPRPKTGCGRNPSVWRARRFCSNRCAGLCAPRTVPKDEAARFWAKVDRTGKCWEWQASKSNFGYGQFMTAAGKCEPAHRTAWRLTHGDAGTARVCHSCDNPICVRPDHLFLGTAADNTADMMAKGRGTVGVKSASAKLTDAQVLAIRADPRPQHVIALDYGVHLCTIGSIRTRRTWRHI